MSEIHFGYSFKRSLYPLNKKARVPGLSYVSGTPDRSRTDDYPLGGDYYIHLTTEAYYHIILIYVGEDVKERKFAKLTFKFIDTIAV